MPSKDRDIVAQVLKMWFHRVGFDFSRAISHNCIAVEQVRVLVVVFFLVFFGFVQQETSIWYHMIRNVVIDVFLGHSTQTDCRSCSVDPKIHHAAKRSLAMCEHTGGVLGDIVLVFHGDIRRDIA